MRLSRDRETLWKIAHELRAAINEGRLGPGDALPTVAELAAIHNVAMGTASRAIALLNSEGLIDVQRGRRVVVASDLHGSGLRP
jgi:integrase